MQGCIVGNEGWKWAHLIKPFNKEVKLNDVQLRIAMGLLFEDAS